jgi:hypothetical protein
MTCVEKEADRPISMAEIKALVFTHLQDILSRERED